MQATVRNALCAKSNSATPHPAIGVSEKYVLRLGSKAMLGSHGLICIHYFPTASHEAPAQKKWNSLARVSLKRTGNLVTRSLRIFGGGASYTTSSLI